MTDNIFTFVDLSICEVRLSLAYYEKKKFNVFYSKNEILPLANIRYQSILHRESSFDTLVKMIYNAEKEHGIIIQEIILIQKSNDISYYFQSMSVNFKKAQTIKANHIDFLIKSTIDQLKQKTIINDSRILDIIKYNYNLDDNIIVTRTDKMLASKITANIGIFTIKERLGKGIESHLERYKIRVKHYISSSIATYNLVKNVVKPEKRTMIIDFGETSTAFCIVENNILKLSHVIELGGFDITRDIANVFSIATSEAEKLKINLSDFANKAPDHIIECDATTGKRYIVLGELMQVVNARLVEILKLINLKSNNDNQIKNNELVKDEDFFDINNIIICGSSSKLHNLHEIASDIFRIRALIINKDIIEASINHSQEITGNLEDVNQTIIGAIIFYASQYDKYKNLEKGLLSKTSSKIRNFIREILY
jgi:cell division protein FtsA